MRLLHPDAVVMATVQQVTLQHELPACSIMQLHIVVHLMLFVLEMEFMFQSCDCHIN